MSDWGATHSTSIEPGLDIEMPGANFMGNKLLAALKAGSIDVSYVDDAVVRILRPMFAMGLFDHPNFNSRANNVTSEAHNDLARKLSAASTVLLKNDPSATTKNNVLPLEKTQMKIALIGRAASDCYTHSGGSGTVSPSRVVTPLMGVLNKMADTALVTYAAENDVAAAVRTAESADVAIIFVGATSSEGTPHQPLVTRVEVILLIFLFKAMIART